MSDPIQIASPKARKRCAVYCRVSSDERLDQEFNSIDAQKEAGHAYVASQRAEGWIPVADDYDDPGFSGGNTDRPGLKRLMADIEPGHVDIVVVYKIDRLPRSLADFSKMVEVFERHDVSFVSVTQQFNTTTPMGRLMLNVLLSFAQFEREVTGERIRDKIAAAKRKGMWMGGVLLRVSEVAKGRIDSVLGHWALSVSDPREYITTFSGQHLEFSEHCNCLH
jgi:DNA invertase Pin-like site-specific DNA recombinase